MKISASIYSNKNQNVIDTINLLNENNVDFIHVDCNDDIAVFDDIALMKKHSTIPVDLHIITPTPEKYYDLIVKHQPEFVTFQHEDLKQTLHFPKEYKGLKGIAITTNTSISIFDNYEGEFDFMLFMATIPGKSGGEFDRSNFKKIIDFQKKYPKAKVHVDGGVNAEVSFILRNMGVYASVSGSYLFNSQNIATALLNLKHNETQSHFIVKDFMRGIEDSPVVQENELDLKNVLEKINQGKLGFTLVTDENNTLKGIIGNADLRYGLLNHLDNLNNISCSEMINQNPITVNENITVNELLSIIKNQARPVLYLPVVNDKKQAVGTLTFMNLIKGEL